MVRIRQCRGVHNRLGFAYQLVFVRLLNRFPVQDPLEVEKDIIVYTSIQLGISDHQIKLYGKRRPTVSEHQDAIREYLGLQPLSESIAEVKAFLFKEAYQLEQTSALTARLREFLRTHRILEPSQNTIFRIYLLASKGNPPSHSITYSTEECRSIASHQYQPCLLRECNLVRRLHPQQKQGSRLNFLSVHLRTSVHGTLFGFRFRFRKRRISLTFLGPPPKAGV